MILTNKKGTKVVSRKFKVAGSGDFAFDMLRYDTCVPATEKDAYHLGRVDSRHDESDQRRRVTLVRYAETWGRAEPTFDRWRSQGWIVVAVECSDGELREVIS